MVSATKNILLATFILSVLWQNSESFNLEYRNRTLARVKRQSQGHACKDGVPFKFQCETTAQCIDEDDQCNGKADCQDGSDEKESLCKNIPCPGYLFKCDYGACISTEQRCDGRKDCNDNSDEIGCNTTNKKNTNCRSDQFECDDGQCIEIDGKCNGVAECTDKSDETEELCLNIFCPGYTYKCKYGACADGDSECNGVMDCIDNSDESEERCGPTKPVTSGPPIVIVPTPSGDGKTCRTPEQPQNGQWVYAHNANQKGIPNVRVESSTLIIFSCNNNYKLSVTNDPKYFVPCEETGEWSLTKMPTCQMLCPPYYSNPIMTVKCNDDGSTVPCDKATDETVLTYKCSPYYEIPVDKPERSICFRGTWDHSPQCIPVCGQKRVDVTPLIVDGKPVQRGNYPWMVALYRSKNAAEFKNICGGSLISTRIVLTAAHCVTNKEGGGKYPPGIYRIAAGKYYNKYKDPRDDDTAQYSDIVQIEVSREYRGADQNFRGDIALLKLKTELKLSKVVQPVCYLNLPLLEPNTNGTVTGWGYTKAGSDPSDVLKELDLPYLDDDTCEQELDPDFKRQYFTTDKFCAGFTFRNTTVCKGDSGGGLVFRNAKYRERFFVHGIVSLAHSITQGTDVLCNIQSAALFTKVDPYLTWIQKTSYQWS